MTAVRPSAHILLDIDKRLDTDDTLAAAMKRSYLYVAATRIGFHNEDLALVLKNAAEENEGSETSLSSGIVIKAENAPYTNTIRLHIHLRKPYWNTSVAESVDLWDNMMRRWLTNISRKISNTMIAFNAAREKNGGKLIVFDTFEYDFEGYALIELALAPDSSLIPNTLSVVEKVRTWYNSGIAKDSVERVRVNTSPDNLFAYDIAQVEIVFKDATSRIISLA